VRLGSLDVPALGVGTWQWGETTYWGGSRDDSERAAQGAYLESRTGGLALFDTAEFYAGGRSERLLGRFIREQRERSRVLVATKFWTPFRVSARALPGALERSIDRLGVDAVDLYQIHWPVPWMGVEALMDAMANVVKAGRVRMVGVSNFSADQMRRAANRLETHGLPLASNQVEYSLLKRAPETNGVLQVCRETGAVLIAYSPLAQGVLTGKYHALSGQTPIRPKGLRRYVSAFSPAQLEKSRVLVEVLTEIGKVRGKSPAQVALNWLVRNGSLPIPGARNADQAKHNAGALGWSLEQAEFEWIDHVSSGRVKF
jgi:aryl-alcohol dehydrogenase-like predicted oxidoreductase